MDSKCRRSPTPRGVALTWAQLRRERRTLALFCESSALDSFVDIVGEHAREHASELAPLRWNSSVPLRTASRPLFEESSCRRATVRFTSRSEACRFDTIVTDPTSHLLAWRARQVVGFLFPLSDLEGV